MTCKSHDNDSGTSTVIGLLLITVIVVVSAVIVIASINAFDVTRPVIANIDIESVDLSNSQKIILVHRGGDSFDVSEISIIISINGETIPRNLVNLPICSSPGFSNISGVLHSWSNDNNWDSGDKGGFNIAKSTNIQLKPGDNIKVTIIHRPTNMIISSPGCRI